MSYLCCLLVTHIPLAFSEENAIHQAAEKLSPKLFRKFIRTTSFLDVGLNAQDDRGQTPLHKTVARSSSQMVKILLEAGARMDIRDDRGKTPINLNSHAVGRLWNNPNVEIMVLLFSETVQRGQEIPDELFKTMHFLFRSILTGEMGEFYWFENLKWDSQKENALKFLMEASSQCGLSDSSFCQYSFKGITCGKRSYTLQENSWNPFGVGGFLGFMKKPLFPWSYLGSRGVFQEKIRDLAKSLCKSPVGSLLCTPVSGQRGTLHCGNDQFYQLAN